MPEITTEQFEQLPDFIKGDYQQDGENYVHVGELKSRALKGSLNDLDSKYKDVSSKLQGIEAKQAEAIEQARTAALEEARTKGDVKAIEERYQQQMADLEQRVREEAKNEAASEFRASAAKEKAKGIAATIGAQLGIDAEDGETIAMLISGRVEIDPETGKEIYRDANGSATSLDRSGFIAEIKKEPRMKRLIKGEVPTSGAGKVNGSTGNQAASKRVSREAFSAMSPAEQMRLSKGGVELY